MNKLITLILLLLTNQGYASWSSFAHVTPATEEKYGLTITLTPVTGVKNTFNVKLNAVDSDHKHAWLIITAKNLSVEEQEFRGNIWQGTPLAKQVLVKTELRAKGKGAESYYEAELSLDNLRTGYIYIDFPSMVLDGGYYYSIDLSTYIPRLNNRPSK